MKYENEIRELLLKTITVTEPIEEITAETDLQNVGMDSLTFIKLIVEIENLFDIEFPDDKLAETGTIKKLCEIVDSILENKIVQ